MSRVAYFLVSAMFSLATAAIVIATAGYYDNPGLLIGQIAGIAGPTFVPFALLAFTDARNFALWFVTAILVSIGWGYTVYVDTRPYEGGGASFAILFGWLGCACVVVFAIAAAFQHERRQAKPPN